MILKKIKLKKRLPLRTLCARIKEIIEAIGIGQKALIITRFDSKFELEVFHSIIRTYSAMLTLEYDHFLIEPNLEESLIVIKPKNFNRYFTDLITRLFPNVEQLFFSRYVSKLIEFN